jgi:MoaA/NifB/PqqE/SkfB family radical SAM enzyme
MNDFLKALLLSQRKNLRLKIKDWGRAYINFGLTRYMKGDIRSLPCGAANDLFFVDPYGLVLACNGSNEPWVMGDLKNQEFDEIWHSQEAEEVRRRVDNCRRNCWMVGTAVPAMRKAPWTPLLWIANNKLALNRKKGKNVFVPKA